MHDAGFSRSAGRLPRGSGERILYIDDDDSLIDLAQRMLGAMGYRVRGFVHADDGLEALRADPSAFDLVVTDYNMPCVSGLEVAAVVAGLRSDLPVVLTSGCNNDEMKRRAHEAGGLRLIEKPGTMDELCTRIIDAFESIRS